MEFGTEELTASFQRLAKELGVSLNDPLPSKSGDYETRMGMKSAPLTDKFEITTVLSVLHATKLQAFPFLEELILRDISGCRVWGSGCIPPDKKTRYEDIKVGGSCSWLPFLGSMLRKHQTKSQDSCVMPSFLRKNGH